MCKMLSLQLNKWRWVAKNPEITNKVIMRIFREVTSNKQQINPDAT